MSFEQLTEWIRHELVPTSVPAESIRKWCELSHSTGKIEDYFRQVEELDMYYPQPPDVSQYLAARPLGQALVNKLQAIDAAQKLRRHHPLLNGRKIVRHHVQEEEAKENFPVMVNNGHEPHAQVGGEAEDRWFASPESVERTKYPKPRLP